jgi:DNA-directed RNA polymerase subunit F
MGAGYVLVILVVAVVVVVGILLSRLGKQRAAQHEEVTRARDTLRYDVPVGQDPAAVLVALSRHGFEAVADPTDSHRLTIVTPLGPQQRDEVRVVLENEAMQTVDELDEHVHSAPVRVRG